MGPRDAGSGGTGAGAKLAAICKSAFGLRPNDLCQLRWLAEARFGINDATRRWLPPYERKGKPIKKKQFE